MRSVLASAAACWISSPSAVSSSKPYTREKQRMLWPTTRIASRLPELSARPISSRSLRRLARKPGTSSRSAGSTCSWIFSGISFSLVGSARFVLPRRLILALDRAPEGGKQDIHVHRLRDVVRGTRLDAFLAVADHRLRRHGDDRQLAVAVELAHDAHRVDAVQARHHHVH